MPKTPISRNLAALISSRDLKQGVLASVAGVSDGSVSKWLSGEVQPRGKYLERIAEHYCIDIDALVSDRNGLYNDVYGQDGAPPGAISPKAAKPAYAALYGRVHAGNAGEPDLLDESVPVPYEVMQRHLSAYLLEVEGDCMDKVYPEGCLVLVDPDLEPADRSIAVVSIDGGDYLMRRLLKGSDTLVLSPESHNPEWRDVVVTRDSGQVVSFVGTVVWFQSARELR